MSSLYLEHFRLGEAPFGITPNGKFFFEGQARGAILDALHHAVLDEDGIVVVVGEVGSGKTMLCRMLAERLPGDQVDLVYLANPSFGPREILQSLIADWGLQPPAEGDAAALAAYQQRLRQPRVQPVGERQQRHQRHPCSAWGLRPWACCTAMSNCLASNCRNRRSAACRHWYWPAPR